MLHQIKSHYIVAMLLTITISHTTFCSEEGIPYKVASNIGDHATKGLMDFLAKTGSESILELVRRELDIRYDNDPTVKTQLDEIASAIVIINNGIELTDAAAKKETANELFLHKGDSSEQAKQEKRISQEALATYKGLQHLRDEHINQLNKICMKRNPDYKPYTSNSPKK